MAPPLPIQEAVTSAQLAELYRVQGKLGLSLDEVVVPVVLVGNLLAASPNADPVASGPRDCAGGVELFQSTVGEFAVAGLHNPVGSGVVAVVTKMEIMLNPASANLVKYELIVPAAPIAFAGGGSPQSDFRDARITGQPACTTFHDGIPFPATDKRYGVNLQMQLTGPGLVDIRTDNQTYIIAGGQQLVWVLLPGIIGGNIQTLHRWWWTEYQDAG